MAGRRGWGRKREEGEREDLRGSPERAGRRRRRRRKGGQEEPPFPEVAGAAAASWGEAFWPRPLEAPDVVLCGKLEFYLTHTSVPSLSVSLSLSLSALSLCLSLSLIHCSSPIPRHGGRHVHEARSWLLWRRRHSYWILSHLRRRLQTGRERERERDLHCRGRANTWIYIQL